VKGTVSITGGSGYVGQLLRRGLVAQGFRILLFDQFRGPLVNVLRRRYLASATSPVARRAAQTIRSGQTRAEPALRRARIIRPRADDILSDRDVLAARFSGSCAVVHLAAIPHPYWPGATEADFIRINYDASVNVFEAARDAGVPTFVFASSAQVYKINDPVRLDQLPILESNYLPLPAEGQTTYGFLKAAFERYLAGACTSGATQAVALRLEYPGFRSIEPANLYISTSIENLVAGFACALRPPEHLGFDVFNIADGEVDPAVVDIQSYIRRRWPYVPNHAVGNQCLLGIEKARRILGYRPVNGGRYVDASLVW
jgi:nucleoside-diphosphate-sugar epimerase